MLNGVGNRLLELRKERNISLSQLSNDVNISKSNLVRYENDKYIPSLESALKLANYYNVTIDYIAKGK